MRSFRNGGVVIPSPFAKKVGTKLVALGKGKPKLVADAYDEHNFGNAAATFELDDLRLRFVRDRSIETMDVEVPDDQGGYRACPLENLAAALDWIAMNDLLKHYGVSEEIVEASFEECPPPGPFHTLDEALQLLEDHWPELARVCLAGSAQRLNDQVQATIQHRLNRLFSAS